MNSKKTITVGVPCYNEELNVEKMYEKLLEITQKIKKHEFNFIFVDNGSFDSTKEMIKEIARKDKNVTGIFLSRNFGPEASAKAIYDYSNGDALIPICCDFQDPPEMIPAFIKKWEEGYHVVAGYYTSIEGKSVMKYFRRIFYRLLKSIANVNIKSGDTGYGLLDKKVINAINSLPEKYRFARGLKSWVGFKVAYVKYKKSQRKYGKSSYNFFDYIKDAERGIFGFSYVPLDLIIYFSLLLVLFSFLSLALFLLFGNPIRGTIAILISVIFLGGVQLMAISVLGKYIQVIVEETKERPNYIVDEIINGRKK